jgi:hypothetical protein
VVKQLPKQEQPLKQEQHQQLPKQEQSLKQEQHQQRKNGKVFNTSQTTTI